MTTLQSIDARSGAPRPAAYEEATPAEAEAVVAAAAAAAPALAALPPSGLAALVRDIGERIGDLGDVLLVAADEETGLGLPRLVGERARTLWQLESFARFIDTGEHLDAVIDRRDPDATAGPRPDLRRVNVPVGPVAVFAASNFPLAFSVAGGDTASALAAGCPVVVKAHPSHPETSELVAGAVCDAVAAAGLPSGTFSLLHGASNAVGAALVEAEAIEAVGFTGSLGAGRALFDLASRRARPIPVYAEMGSANPVFITAAAMHNRADAIADGLASSFTLGVGQFCTKPGQIHVVGADAAARLAAAIAERVADASPAVLLNDRLRSTLDEQLGRTVEVPGVAVIQAPARSGRGATPVVLLTDEVTLAANPSVGLEHFGPVVLIVAASDDSALVDVAAGLDGNLTATVHAEEGDADWAASLLAILSTKVGRIVWNGYPTGVAVTGAMVHGGPYPATTAPATTSVGLAAIRRFLRPVAFQETPDALLPPALQDANPLGIVRKVNGD